MLPLIGLLRTAAIVVFIYMVALFLLAQTRKDNSIVDISWGIGLNALSSPSGWAALFGPVSITSLLLFVSGVPLLEKKYAGRPDWEAYKARTPKFFPWFPRSN